jgi:two-component system response regulator NreC
LTVDILLADDHPVVRQGLRALLEGEQDFRLVGEASDGVEVAPLVERLRPDVVVLDLKMPRLGGLEVARQLAACAPETKVVVLSMYSEEAYVAQALRAGAMAYVLKEAKADDLLTAIREAVAGRRFLSPPLSERSVESYLETTAASTLDPYETLSPREREIVVIAAQGLSNPDISRKLGISPRTVETHRANLMRKLKLKGQTDLVRYAIKRGLLPDT